MHTRAYMHTRGGVAVLANDTPLGTATGRRSLYEEQSRYTMLFAAVHDSGFGKSRRFAAAQHFGRFRSEADTD
jgi:hypothetical protein